MVGDDDADDCTQEVFVKVWGKVGTFRGDAAFGTWLYRVAIHELLAYRRSRGRYDERFQEDDGIIDRSGSAAREAGIAVDLEAAVAALPDRARRVLVLHDVEGFKHHEIADMLEVTIGTSKSQLHRARTLVRAQLAS